MGIADYREPYRGKTILVTGGAGAIGSNLTRALGELGARMVLVLDDLSSASRWNVPSLPNVMFVEGSILDEVELKGSFLKGQTWSITWRPCSPTRTPSTTPKPT